MALSEESWDHWHLYWPEWSIIPFLRWRRWSLGKNYVFPTITQLVRNGSPDALAKGLIPHCWGPWQSQLYQSRALPGRELGTGGPQGRKTQPLLSRSVLNRDGGVRHTTRLMPLSMAPSANSPRGSASYHGTTHRVLLIISGCHAGASPTSLPLH